jgi:outer membrane immunogenic protein
MSYGIRRAGSGALFALVLAFAAQAADLGAPPINRLPPLPSWTGCYVGVNAGGGWAQASLNDPIGVATLGTVSRGGLAGGGQIGCDYQAGPLLFGIQGMADVANIVASGLQPNALVTTNFSAAWIETLTARFGVVVHPTVLLYVKGGGAWMQESLSMTFAGFTVATGKTTLTGWTAGAGIEFMFAPNWSVFVEYSYQGFPNNQTSLIVPGGIIPISFNSNFNAQTALIGLNFRFGDPLVPPY